jgi:hypothetical protein
MDLKPTLARQSPDPGFAGRVMARIHEMEPPRVERSAGSWWRAAAATLLLTALGAGWTVHHARGEMLLALRIAGSKVRTAQQHVRDIGTH